MKPTTKNSRYPEPENQKILRVEFADILYPNGQPVHGIIIIENNNGVPVVEVISTYSDGIGIEVRSRQVTELSDMLNVAQNKITALTTELTELQELLKSITAPPAALDYSDLVNIAMIQASGEINGWNNVTLSDSNFYATHKARAETNPQYLAILNSCRSNYRVDKEADEMNARFEKLMKEMADAMTPEQKLTLDEQIALGLYEEELRVGEMNARFDKLENSLAADIAEWENRVAQGEVEADEAAARQEEEAGADPARRFLEEDMVHDHFAEQWAADQD